MEFNTTNMRDLAMANQPVPEKIVKPIVAEDPRWIITPWASICVYGWEHISKKDLEIVAACFHFVDFEDMDHNCRIIRFRTDGRPVNTDGKPLMAIANAEVGGMVINMAHTFNLAMAEMRKQHWDSMLTCWHRNMLMNVLHELFHLTLDHTANVSDEDAKNRDNAAEEWALDKMYELGKTKNVEPSHYSQMPFYAKMAQITLDEMEDDSALKRCQTHMHENHIMHTIEAGDDPEKQPEFYVQAFKTILQNMSGDGKDHPDWDVNTNGESMEAYVAETSNGIGSDSVVQFVQPILNEVTGSEQVEPEEPVAPQFAGRGIFPTDVVNPSIPASAPATGASIPPIPSIAPNFPVGNTTGPVSAAMAPVNPVPTGPALPQTGFTPQQTGDIIQVVYMKCYANIFNNCGRLLNSDLGFQNPEAIGTTPVALTPEEQKVVFKCDCLDENGRWCPGTLTTAGVRGFIMKNSKLPVYKLYINDGGTETVRLLLPQNPARQSANAKAARAGSCIMYIMEGDRVIEEQLKAQGSGKNFYFRIIDNILEACN